MGTDVYVCVYPWMYVYPCSAIPAPAKNDAELGDDKNDIMAFNMLGRVHKQIYMGTCVTASSAKCTGLALPVLSLQLCVGLLWSLWFQGLLSTEASRGVNQHPPK